MRTSFKKFFDAYNTLNEKKLTLTNRELALRYRLWLLLEKRYNVRA